ncbi:MAG TPA: UbiD family decarboxylase [Rhodocyclaceae bacterium]|nr:UbiD family decarboxylase [Rhodocyclaceae bacterium]
MKTKRQGVANQAMPLTDLGACIAALEAAGNLIRVRSEVSPRFELAGVARRLEGTKPVLFERVKGHAYPVLTGLLWNRAVVASLFGVAQEQVPFRIAAAVGRWQKNKAALPSRLQDAAPANEVVEDVIDLSMLPLPVHALKDGGRYLDSSLVVARHPETGGINASIHRIQMTRKDRLSFLIDPGRHLGEYVAIAERRGEALPVTINNGVGLAPWLVASLPRLGEGKPAVANHLAGRAIPWMKAQSVDVPAYAEAQFVIEAEILPGVRESEGPFAEVTGYYGGRDKRYVMKVKKITRRHQPVFHTVLSGQEVWNAVGFTAEAAIFGAVQGRIPEVRAVFLPPGGCGFYQAVVQVANTRPGIGREVINETFKAFRSLQRVVVVDTDVNLYDATDVDWAITTRFDPDTDLVILPRQEGHILNPIVKQDDDGKGGTVTKMGIDALIPFDRDRAQFTRVKFKEVQLSDYDIAF